MKVLLLCSRLALAGQPPGPTWLKVPDFGSYSSADASGAWAPNPPATRTWPSGQLLASGRYWDEIDYADDFLPEPFIELAAKVDSRFFAMDIALR